MSSLMFYCLKVLISAIFEKPGQTDGPTHGLTNRQTNGQSLSAWTHLKIQFYEFPDVLLS